MPTQSTDIQSPLGMDLKPTVRMEPFDGLHLADLDFTLDIYTSKPDAANSKHFKKDELIKIDEDQYMCALRTEGMGRGEIWGRLTVFIPDGDFPDGLRKEMFDGIVGHNLY